MIKFYLISLFLLFSSILSAEDNNLTTFNIVKVNNHTVTSNIFSTKKANAILHKFSKYDKKRVINQLVNDEIAIQYAFNYNKLEDNITDEKKRLNVGLTLINNIAIKESLKYISDKNVSNFYNSNKKEFWHKKQYSASHILVKDLNLSKKLIIQLKNSFDLNRTFKSLAKDFSKDSSSINGGYLGFFESKIMVTPFKDALERLKVNQFTDKPVKTKFGYHIIYLHEISNEGYVPLEKVKQLIKVNLAKKIKNRWFTETLSPLKKTTKIEYLLDINSSH